MSRQLCSLPNLIYAYDRLSANMKSHLLFQLLKRSSSDTLQFVDSVVAPIFKRDLLTFLPRELALQILSYLDVRSLCRAASVSKQWRAIVDSDDSTWRRLLERDGFQPSWGSWPHGKQEPRYDDTMGEMGSLSSPPPPTHKKKEKSRDNTFSHPYKESYRRQYILRQNWRHGRAARISFPGHLQHVVTCLQFDDDKIVSGADDEQINIYNTKTGQKLRSLRGHEGGVWALQYVDNILVSGSTDRTVRVWDIERGVCTHIFRGHTSTVRCLQIVVPTMVNGRLEPKEPLIITGSRDATLRIWRLPDPRKDEPYNGIGVNPWHMHTLVGHSHSVRAIAVHGYTLVSGSYDNTVAIWNIETGQLVHRMEGHTQKVYTVMIDTRRQRCMSGSMDSTVRVWDLITGQCLQVLIGHSILVGLLGLTDQYIVSAAADTTLRVWSAETGACQQVLTGHRGAITCFQHDNEKVISGSEGALKMWDIKTGEPLKDLITDVTGIWRVAFDHRRCVAAVHRDNVTSFEVLDFGVYGLT
ncbi:WD40-repeat-containing domain protein [Radiomyces spectabilis]|uniref:WD40-repeat-containing domain protein n=1 Tax=Radiomyces spectabilis TaxID=64574 RepID=UPI00221FDBF3|nr:WD40-repeat-containing domain protein [Radiomyces spectabilis]KAI8377941.1 WD40-repeat-containing domain protein [Radiomyces spectabilis]